MESADGVKRPVQLTAKCSANVLSERRLVLRAAVTLNESRHRRRTLVRLPWKPFEGCFSPFCSPTRRQRRRRIQKKPHGRSSVSGATVRVDGREGAEDRVQPLQQHHGSLPEDQRGLHPGGGPDEVRPAAGLQAHGGQL